MDRAMLLALWDESWETGIWITPWIKAVEGLSAVQAAWKPAAARHSIWQNVTHVVFWRTITLDTLAGRARPPQDVMDRLNFAEPGAATEPAWKDARQRLAASHMALRAAIADEKNQLDRLKYHLGHDAYHLGQIMYLRALQGLSPIE